MSICVCVCVCVCVSSAYWRRSRCSVWSGSACSRHHCRRAVPSQSDLRFIILKRIVICICIGLVGRAVDALACVVVSRYIVSRVLWLCKYFDTTAVFVNAHGHRAASSWCHELSTISHVSSQSPEHVHVPCPEMWCAVLYCHVNAWHGGAIRISASLVVIRWQRFDSKYIMTHSSLVRKHCDGQRDVVTAITCHRNHVNQCDQTKRRTHNPLHNHDLYSQHRHHRRSVAAVNELLSSQFSAL